MKQKIVIDTDVGTDCDDLFALTYALKNPNADVKAISTVIGDTVIRAKIVRKLERMIGVNVPIIAGQTGSEDSVKKYWTGIEEKALSEEEKKEDFVSGNYPVYTSNTRLVCIGPLTNIAYQLENNPSIRNIREVYVMGSTDSSHNFKADLDAWHKVQLGPWNIYQVTKDVSEKVSFSRDELGELAVNPIGKFLYDSAIRWLDHTKRDKACMYDVLTVSAAIGEKYVRFDKVDEKRFISRDVDVALKDKIIETVRS